MTTRAPGLWLHAVGVTSPLGDSAPATAAAVRAGISRRQRSDQRNRQGEPMIVSSVPDAALPPLTDALADRPAHHRRLLALATHALREAAAMIADTISVPLLLALPEPHPRVPREPPDHDILADLQLQTGVPLALASSHTSTTGRAGPLYALANALTIAADPTIPGVLVGGVDSYREHDLLAALDRDRRVLAAGRRDGFAPGEGAGFLLLSRRRVLATSHAHLFLHAPGTGEEPGHHHSDEPHRGDGLSAAIAAATHHTAPAEISAVFAGLNGEHYGAREWQVAALRSSAAFAPRCTLEHPVDCLGDPGAALAPTLIALAAVALQRGHHSGPILVWSASDGPARGAVVLRRVED